MSTAMWKLEKDLCRCCHAEGSFKHLSDPCFLLGQEEIYSVMLQESLDIKVVPMTGPLSDATYTICEACVLRLRDASNFKRQVQECEERFKEMYSKNMIRGFEVKDEPLESDADMKHEFHSLEDDDDDDDDDDDAFLKFDDDADDSFEEHEEMVSVEIEGLPKTKGKGKAKPKPKSKKAAPVKKTKTKEKPIKLESEELTEAAVSGEKRKDEEEHNMKACFKCKIIRKVEDVGSSWTCPDCATVLTDCVVRLVREQLPGGPITNFFITTETGSNRLSEKTEPEPAGSSDGGPAAASVLRHYLLRGMAGNSKEDDSNEHKESKKPKPETKEKLEMYGCVECNRTFGKRSSLTTHIRRSHQRVKLKCPDCGEGFRTKRQLQTHVKRVHDKDTEPVKGKIKKKWKTKSKYQDLIKLRGDELRLSCRQCDFESEDRNELISHIRSNHIQQLTCQICGEVFPDRKLLEQHKTIPHTPKHSCKLCEQKFTKKMLLIKHNKHRHGLIKCQYCPEIVSKAELKNHLSQLHKDLIPTCGVCGLQAPSQGVIINHQRRVHLKEKNVTCTVCKFQCYGYPQLKRHMIRHIVDKVYACRFCKKTFPRPTTCRIHEMIHTGEKNKVCDVCNAAFVQKASLNYHMLKHHPDHV